MKRTILFTLAILCFCLISTAAPARDLRASLPLIPVMVDSRDKGVLVDLVKAMAEEYKEGKITWEVYPFARSIENIEKGRADFHMPFLVNPNISSEKLPFQFSSESIFTVQFCLYTNKNNREINPSNVSKFNIETDQAHVQYLNFKVTGSPDIESSLRKVDMGRTDGWIFAMYETDALLKKFGLKNIKRWPYKRFDVRMIVAKGEKGKEVDKIVSGLIKKLKANGKYQKVMGKVADQKYEDWQP
jgi:polar amino acid transport system substrate-binding protein